jgi:phosphoenolpyruvate-protein kinase (PTS system EI component)
MRVYSDLFPQPRLSVTVRTADIGGDKQLRHLLGLSQTYLGLRAHRSPAFTRAFTQPRAILRAASCRLCACYS